MLMRRWLSVLGAAVLVVAGAFVATPTASAKNIVWFQSVGRASADAPCPDPSFGTPWESHWNPAEQPWRPSWAQWMNGGRGGYTCDRQITWAWGPPDYPSAGCMLHDDGAAPVDYVNFNGGWSLGETYRFSDANCTTLYDTPGSPYGAYIVFAPDGFDGAALCREAFGDRVLFPAPLGGNGVWACYRPVV